MQKKGTKEYRVFTIVHTVQFQPIKRDRMHLLYREMQHGDVGVPLFCFQIKTAIGAGKRFDCKVDFRM